MERPLRRWVGKLIAASDPVKGEHDV
jgi:hypothetical protein